MEEHKVRVHIEGDVQGDFTISGADVDLTERAAKKLAQALRDEYTGSVVTIEAAEASP